MYIPAVASVGSRRGFFLSGRLRWETMVVMLRVCIKVLSDVRVEIERVLAICEARSAKAVA